VTKKYESELAKLNQTFQEASETDVVSVHRFLDSIPTTPVIAVGSGGSYTAAEYLAVIHESSTDRIGNARTPLSFLTSDLPSECCVALISASGRNKDILRSLEHAKDSDVEHILIVTNSPDSPLAERAKELGNPLVFDLDLTVRRDGYLATNTLLGTVTALCKAYTEAFDLPYKIETSLADLLHPTTSREVFFEDFQQQIGTLREANTLLVLFGGWSRVGAVDTESRMAESGLKNVQLTDVRNFAHGRHQWIVQHKERTGVIAFNDPEVSPIMGKTLERLPKDVPTVELSTQFRGPLAGIVQVINSIYIPGMLAKSGDIDPGRPSVPDWARRIHHLTPRLNRDSNQRTGSSSATSSLPNPPEGFLSELESADFQGLVLNYDGTLVTTHGRFDPPKPQLSEQLNRLLDEGLHIGVATGRGQSARKDLRSILSETFWSQVVVGYYNGTDLAPLTEDHAPDGTPEATNEGLQSFIELWEQEGHDIFSIEARPNQLSIEDLPRDLNVDDVWFAIQKFKQLNDLPIKVLASGHSLDIIPTSASKGVVVEEIADMVDTTTDRILRIGDRGAWPGNDHELLSHPLGLSVDQSATTGPGGYRITPSGLRGPGATVKLLRSIETTDDGWRVNIEQATQDRS
jgi:fructoselysine-6-P-deglycase FrlB-like protein/hydroxymethylpyrimidine pyrophosphatase-like HAD family hydrolase